VVSVAISTPVVIAQDSCTAAPFKQHITSNTALIYSSAKQHHRRPALPLPSTDNPDGPRDLGLTVKRNLKVDWTGPHPDAARAAVRGGSAGRVPARFAEAGGSAGVLKRVLRIPMMSISHSDLMPIRTERSDAGPLSV